MLKQATKSPFVKLFLQDFKLISLCMMGFVVGYFLDLDEDLRLTRYRDQSKLYGYRHKEGDPPTWPTWFNY